MGRLLKYYGDYVIGKESNWQSFCTKFELDWTNELKPTARKGVSQFETEDVYLIELVQTDERMLYIASKETGLFVLKQHLVSQLGIDSIYKLRDKKGNGIFVRDIEDEVNEVYLIDKPWALLNIYYSCDSTCPSYFADSAAVITYMNENHTTYTTISRLTYLGLLLNVFYDASEMEYYNE